jgi:conjugal transfer ATP-binding protein TraC
MGPPVLVFVGRRGQLQALDIFTNPTGGYSGVISAATGAGKSVFANELTLSYLGVGAKVWTIDVGRSYEKLCRFLGGDFIVFGREGGVCLNPFSNVIDINDEMPQLKAIIAQMASSQALDELSRSFIEEAIQGQFEKLGRAMTVTDVAEFLASGSDPVQKELSKRLYLILRRGPMPAILRGNRHSIANRDMWFWSLRTSRRKRIFRRLFFLPLSFRSIRMLFGTALRRKSSLLMRHGTFLPVAIPRSLWRQPTGAFVNTRGPVSRLPRVSTTFTVSLRARQSLRMQTSCFFSVRG